MTTAYNLTCYNFTTTHKRSTEIIYRTSYLEQGEVSVVAPHAGRHVAVNRMKFVVNGEQDTTD